jgi:hypothetical protein
MNIFLRTRATFRTRRGHVFRNRHPSRLSFGYVSTQPRDTASAFDRGLPLKEAAAVIFQKTRYLLHFL